MEPSMVVVLSSSPPSLETSTQQQALPKVEAARRIAIPAHGLCTPTKDKNDIWKLPSSSPLPSPGQILRALMDPKLRRGGQNTIGKGFKTARELLETEKQEGDLLFRVGDCRHANQHAAIEPDKSTTQPAVTKKKPRAPRKTAVKSEKTVKRAATVSSHFSKRGKNVNASNSSKSLSPVEDEPKTHDNDKSSSLHVAATKVTQQRKENSRVGVEEEVHMLPVPTRRRDWTPVKNTVPIVEIISSPMVRKAEYEAFGGVESGDLTSETVDENRMSTPSKRTFGDKIGLLRYDSNSASQPSTEPNLAPVASLPSFGTTKRCIQVLEKPQSRRSVSTLSSGAKAPVKRGRKKAETITELVTAQYRTEGEENLQESPSILDFLTKLTPADSSNHPEPQAKKRKSTAKSKATTEAKKTTKPRRGRKAAKEEVEEPVQLLSPESAIRRTKEQGIIFGTFSQLADGKPDVPPDTEAIGTKDASGSDNHGISVSSQFCGLAKASSRQIYSPILDEESEALERFLHSEFDKSEVTKAKTALKRSGLWEAATRNEWLETIEHVDLSMTPEIDNHELDISVLAKRKSPRRKITDEHMSTQVETIALSSSIPVSPTSMKGRKAKSVTPDAEEVAKESVTPSKKKTKKATMKLFAEASEATPPAEGSDAEALDIVPSKRKKSNGKTTKATTGSPKPKKAANSKKATSPAKSKAKRRAKSPLSSPACKKRRSSSASETLPTASSSSHAIEDIHRYIHKAIMAEHSSSENIGKSWHYKILTYEPLILEDFTIWLNTVGFGKVGMDDEVSPEVVKEWADARAVVNVWREGNRGQERKRF